MSKQANVIGHTVAVVRPPGVPDEELARFLDCEVEDTLGHARDTRDFLAASLPDEDLGVFEFRGAYALVGGLRVAGRAAVTPRRVE